jgi:diadenosine tetraphosphate (Ap4A) HIT family hydrolase
MNECVFCRIVSGDIPAEILMHNDTCFVIRDIAPKAPLHLLIILKKHKADILALDTLESARDIFSLAQEVAQTQPNAKEFKLVINNGYTAGQRIFHLHAHFLAGSSIEAV